MASGAKVTRINLHHGANTRKRAKHLGISPRQSNFEHDSAIFSMPHKHKRKRETNITDYDLPPSQRARPLPVGNKKQSSSLFLDSSKNRGRSTKKKSQDNDTPRAFRRIMAAAQGKKTKSGLDNGLTAQSATTQADQKDIEALKIRPGEDMRSFSARVDATLPVAGLTRKTATKDGKDSLGFKVWRTNKERKMHRLYDQWREEERKINERREEELEEAAERELDNDAAGITSSSFKLEQNESGGGGGRKKKNRRKLVDEDPWAVLRKKRAEARPGLHDVAQAPPELHKDTTRHLKIGGAAVEAGNIPKRAGSLRRREELQIARDDVLEAYRKIREHEQRKLTAANTK